MNLRFVNIEPASILGASAVETDLSPTIQQDCARKFVVEFYITFTLPKYRSKMHLGQRRDEVGKIASLLSTFEQPKRLNI